MLNRFSRTENLLGTEAMIKLKNSRVAIFGIGGVGGHAAEAIARSGVGSIDLIDNDNVSETNINRQLVALTSTVGQSKTKVMKQRIMDINPDCQVKEINRFFLPETKKEFDFSQYDYVVDAIDTVAGKIELVMCAEEADVPIISSMGAGNKLDPSAFMVEDIYKTSVCPLAKVMRRELKKRGIKKLKVVYSKEEPCSPKVDKEIETKGTAGRPAPASVAFVPSVVGLIIASQVVRDLAGV